MIVYDVILLPILKVIFYRRLLVEDFSCRRRPEVLSKCQFYREAVLCFGLKGIVRRRDYWVEFDLYCSLFNIKIHSLLLRFLFFCTTGVLRFFL